MISLKDIMGSTSFHSSSSFWILRKRDFFPSEINPTKLGYNMTFQLFPMGLLFNGEFSSLREGRNRWRCALLPVSWWCLTGCQDGIQQDRGSGLCIECVGFAVDSFSATASAGVTAPLLISSRNYFSLSWQVNSLMQSLLNDNTVLSQLFSVLVSVQILVFFSLSSSKISVPQYMLSSAERHYFLLDQVH